MKTKQTGVGDLEFKFKSSERVVSGDGRAGGAAVIAVRLLQHTQGSSAAWQLLQLAAAAVHCRGVQCAHCA